MIYGDIPNLVDGEEIFVESYLTKVDPANSTIQSRFVNSSKSEVKKAVNSAKKAQIKWKKLTPIARYKILKNFSALVEVEVRGDSLILGQRGIESKDLRLSFIIDRIGLVRFVVIHANAIVLY